ncbi:hypothetical protein [Rhizobium sp. BR 314]|uniref:hypothetical protein n=1 Tax=Rhizobium sp. BR 314 TaxID=3040013 RepID=UPI0039BF09B5
MMEMYDCYLNKQKPAVGLYVRTGAALPEFADPKEWIFDGTSAADLLPSSVIEEIAADGYAFRNMD